MPYQGLACYGNEISYSAPIVSRRKSSHSLSASPKYGETTDSADNSSLPYNEITISDQDFQVYLSCEGDDGSGGNLAAAAVADDD